MNRKIELLKNTFLVAIGRCSTQVLGFLLLPLYTSILSTTEYGNYDLLNTISIFIIPFITLLMEEAMFRFLIDAKDDKENGIVITQSVVLTLTNLLLVSLIILIVGSIIKYDYTIYLILFISASILSTLAGSCARGQGKFKIYSLFAFLSSFSTLLLNVLFIAVFRIGVVGLFLAYFIGNTLVSLWLLFKLKVHKMISLKNVNKKKMKEMLGYSIPLVPNSISWITINLSDRLIIAFFLGAASNGIYAISNKFSTIINTFYSFFNMAWKESASKALNDKEKDKFYNNIYINLKHLLISVVIGLLAYLPVIFPILVNKDYHSAYTFIPFLLLSIYCSNLSSYSSGIFAAYKDTKVMGTSTIIAAIINLVVNLTLVNFIGLYAAAISTLVSTLIVYNYRMIKLKKYINLDKDKYGFMSMIIFGILVFTYYSNNIIIYIVGLVIGTIYPIYLNRGIINSIFKKLRRVK